MSKNSHSELKLIQVLQNHGRILQFLRLKNSKDDALNGKGGYKRGLLVFYLLFGSLSLRLG
jgi:hypothetical protein